MLSGSTIMISATGTDKRPYADFVDVAYESPHCRGYFYINLHGILVSDAPDNFGNELLLAGFHRALWLWR
jgi:hypothetical protein